MTDTLTIPPEQLLADLQAAQEETAIVEDRMRIRIKHIFERYVAVYNKYHVLKMDVAAFNVFVLLDNWKNEDGVFTDKHYLYISNCDAHYAGLELREEYFFDTDSTLEFYEQTLKLLTKQGRSYD